MSTPTDLVETRCTRLIAVGDGYGDHMTLNCSTRDGSQCPYCARLYKQDWFQLILSGLVHDIDKPKPASGYRPLLTDEFNFFFLTLTAPSFGHTHRVPKPGRALVNCGCGKTHSSDDHYLRGVPLDYAKYDYDAQIKFNFDLGILWNATRTALTQKLPEMAFLKVCELQARGAGHLHIIIRLPKHYEVTPAEILRTAQAQRAWGDISDGLIGWGEQADCQQLGSDPKTAARQAGYLLKVASYTVKSLNAKLIQEGMDFRPYRAHVDRLHAAAHRVICPSCVQVAGEYRCGSRKHGMWGLSQQPLSLSRPRTSLEYGYIPGWSLVGWTRTSLKKRRQEYMAAKRGGVSPFYEPVPVETRQMYLEANRAWRLGEGFRQENLLALRANWPLKPQFDAVSDKALALLANLGGKPSGSERPQGSERTGGVAPKRSAGTARSALDPVMQSSKPGQPLGCVSGGLSPGFGSENRLLGDKIGVAEAVQELFVEGLTREKWQFVTSACHLTGPFAGELCSYPVDDLDYVWRCLQFEDF